MLNNSSKNIIDMNTKAIKLDIFINPAKAKNPIDTKKNFRIFFDCIEAKNTML